MTLGSRSRNDLDLQYSQIFIISIGFRSQAAVVLKNKKFSLFSYRKSLSYQIWPCHKIGQGQPRVIIWTNYDGQESSLLQTKFCGNQSTGSREEDFWRVFTIYGRGSHFGNVTSIMSIYFHFLEPENLHVKFGFDWPSGFLKKASFKFHMWLTLRSRSRNDLDLQYSHIFIVLCNFRSQAAKDLKNQQFSLFPIEKP